MAHSSVMLFMDHKNKSVWVGKCLRRGVGGEDDGKRPVDVAPVINTLGSHFVKCSCYHLFHWPAFNFFFIVVGFSVYH